MALTATATGRVLDDILKCLHLKESHPKIIVTSFHRPNLIFSVHHSRTSHPGSYKEDFEPVIKKYKGRGGSQRRGRLDHGVDPDHSCQSPDKVPDLQPCQLRALDEAAELGSATAIARAKCPEVAPLPGGNLDDDPEHIPTEFEETDDDETDDYVARGVGGRSIQDTQEMPMNPEEKRIGGDFEVQPRGYSGHRLRKLHRKLSTSIRHGGNRNRIGRRNGACIIYMPTRTETEKLTAYFRRRGVKTMAYHSQLPKTHLEEVHDLFHADHLQVVIATIAFGMGIHKPNISHVIHYGWPQSLED